MDNFMNEDSQLSLKRFELMLQTNKVYFFDSEEFEEIVYYYMDSGKMNLANKAIELSLSQHPTSLPLKLIKVELLVFENKLKEAEKLLTVIENINPNIDEIYIQKASIVSKSDNHQAAIAYLYKALSLTEDFVDVHSLLGMEFLFIENFKQAIEHFSECLKIDIEDYSALYNVIYCFDMLDEHKKAIRFLNAYIDENPYSEVAWHQLGRQFVKLNKYDEAVRAFDYAIIVDEYFIGAYLEKAKALEALKKYEEAISNYLLTLELDDATAFTYLQISGCYNQLKKLDLALDYCHKAVDEDPLLSQSWLFLTSLYIESNKPEKAFYYIQKALDISPNNTDFLNRLAEVYIKLNLFEEASLAFHKSIENGDKRLIVFLSLSDTLHFLGEYDDSCNVLFQALNNHPNAMEIYYRLAGNYFILKKDNEALNFLEKALKNNPSYKNKIEELFPEMFLRMDVVNLLAKSKF